MEVSPTPQFTDLQPASSAASQHREQQQQQQTKFLKLTVPVALIVHALAIGGWVTLASRIPTQNDIEEVEIVADNTSDQPQPMDPNGEGGGGGGGGSSKFSLFNTPGGTIDGNNIAALGNPFTSPEVVPELAPIPTTTAESASVESVPQDAIEPIEPKLNENLKPDNKTESKTESKPESKPKDASIPQKNGSQKPGEFDGSKKGTGDKGDPNGGTLNPNAQSGLGSGGGSGSGKGPGTGSGSGGGSGSGKGPGTGSGSGNGKKGIPIAVKQTTPQSAPIAQSKPSPEAVKPVAVANVPKIEFKKPSGPKCVQNCDLDQYLGAEGSVRISQEIDKKGNVTAKLLKSSGDPEVDRKALEAIQNRKYESSDDGYRSNIRVTSEEEGSDFARQQQERRRQENQERDSIARDRTLQEQERQAREPEIRPAPSEPKPIVPDTVVAEPIVPERTVPVPEPVVPVPEPVTPEPVTPEPVAPASEPVAPIPELVTPEPVFPEPVAPELVVPAPVTPEPVAPVSEPVAPTTP